MSHTDSPRAAPPIRFSIGEPLLERLRAHRTQRRIEDEQRLAALLSRKTIPPTSVTTRSRILGWFVGLFRWLILPFRSDPNSRQSATPNQDVSFIQMLGALSPGKNNQAIVTAHLMTMDSTQREVEEQFDAFLLDPGMGPMTYITADGRILEDMRTWDGNEVVEVTSLNVAIASLAVGARKTGIQELLDLIPSLVGGVVCPLCHGHRFLALQNAEDQSGGIICILCHGRGEVDDQMLKDAADRGFKIPS